MHSFCAQFLRIEEICRSNYLTTARQFTRKDSPPALFYVHSNHTPPASPETPRKGVFQGQSFSKNQIPCGARDSATHTGSVTSMISLTTLLASATVAAAAKKVEDAPAPGIVDTVLGFVPSWLGGPVAQIFDKGVETLGCVFGWITAGPQVVADVVACVKINH